MNRIYQTFPYLSSTIINRYRNNRKWSEYYIDLRRINKNNNKLTEASKNGRLDLVMVVLNQEANIHTQDDYALRWAAGNGHLDVVKYLVEKGANIHAYNELPKMVI